MMESNDVITMSYARTQARIPKSQRNYMEHLVQLVAG
jgi:hypothetical protein